VENQFFVKIFLGLDIQPRDIVFYGYRRPKDETAADRIAGI
jgi:hypothetical protein